MPTKSKLVRFSKKAKSSANERGEKFFLPLLVFVLVLIVWQGMVWLTGTTVFPSPRRALAGLHELVRKGIFLAYIRDSLLRVTSGYSLAIACGIPLGILMGWYAAVARAVNPLIQILRPISPLAWIPLAVVWFGISELAPISLIFMAAFFPVVVSTMDGVRRIPKMYIQAGKNFGLTPLAIFARVIFPAILPQVLNGLRIALGVAWLVVVAAEMIAVDSGLGYLIIDSRNAGQRYDLVVAGMITIGGVGLLLDLFVRRVETIKFVRWGFRP